MNGEIFAEPDNRVYRFGWPNGTVRFNYEDDGLRCTTEYGAEWLYIGQRDGRPYWMLLDDSFAFAAALPDGGVAVTFRPKELG